MTIKLTSEEARRLAERAADAGLPVRPYMRRELLRDGGGEATVPTVVRELRRLVVLTCQFWEAAADNELRPERVREITLSAGAADLAGLTAAGGGK